MLPPSRHNPNPDPPPGRRPRVAGLRKPGESPRPRPAPERADDAQAGEAPAGSSGPEQEPTAHGESPQHGEPEQARDEAEHPDAASQAGMDATSGERADAVDESEPDVAEQAAKPSPKPSPRPKTRREASGKPAAERELVGAAAPGTPPARLRAARAGKPRRRLSNRATYILAAGLLVLAATFTTGAVFAKMGYSDVAKATNNTALLNVSKTQEVKKAMKSAAEQLFSFDYRNIDKTEKAAKNLLVNKDVQQKYSMLMDEVKRLAPKQKIVVSVSATEAAVVRMQEDSAKVIVYVDQTSTRTESKQSSAGGAALWFKTELRDGKWKVVDMDTYNSGAAMQPKKQGGQQGGKQQGENQGGQQDNSKKPQPSKPSGN